MGVNVYKVSREQPSAEFQNLMTVRKLTRGLQSHCLATCAGSRDIISDITVYRASAFVSKIWDAGVPPLGMGRVAAPLKYISNVNFVHPKQIILWKFIDNNLISTSGVEDCLSRIANYI